jgi:TRAP-type C4-dicarboxylate transport system permease small subunit
MRETDDLPHAGGLVRLLRAAAGAFAIAGGLVLSALVLLVVASVLGRALFAMPVPGDFELVGIGMGISVFLFLPYCYLERGNVTVDILARRTPAAAGRVLDWIAAILFAAIAALLAWRMTLGLADTFFYGDISMIVGVPLWWVYPVAIGSFALQAVSAVYVAIYGWSAVESD